MAGPADGITDVARRASHVHGVELCRRDVPGRVESRRGPLHGDLHLGQREFLKIGATYAIARDGDYLRVFGPVDAGQLTVRHEGPVFDFDVTAMDDRVIIAGRDGRSSVAIVFRTIGGMRAADLELALAANDS